MASKYKVSDDKSKRTYDGIVFDSALEMRYYKEVVLPKYESGEIKHFELQKVFVLQPKFKHEGKTYQAITYVSDFYIEYADGRIEVIDTKGFADQKAPMKKKMFLYLYPDLPLRWISYSKMDGGWIDYDDLKKARAKRKKEKIKRNKRRDGICLNGSKEENK